MRVLLRFFSLTGCKQTKGYLWWDIYVYFLEHPKVIHLFASIKRSTHIIMLQLMVSGIFNTIAKDYNRKVWLKKYMLNWKSNQWTKIRFHVYLKFFYITDFWKCFVIVKGKDRTLFRPIQYMHVSQKLTTALSLRTKENKSWRL